MEIPPSRWSTAGRQRGARPYPKNELREPSPNLNAYAERWVKSVKDECLSKIILFGERSLRRALSEYVEHYHAERNHQGKSNVLLFRRVTQTRGQIYRQALEAGGMAFGPGLSRPGAALDEI